MLLSKIGCFLAAGFLLDRENMDSRDGVWPALQPASAFTLSRRAFSPTVQRAAAAVTSVPARGGAPRAAADVADAAAWAPVQDRLDRVPVFAVRTRDGNAIARADGPGLPEYYADYGAAEAALEKALTALPDVQLITVGLGTAYRDVVKGKALLLPSSAALARAGEDWDQQDLPLFLCLALHRRRTDEEGGGQETPFFLDPSDADASLGAAREASAASLSAEDLAQLQLSMTSLPNAVELMLAGREAETCGDQFAFVPPTSTVALMQAALGEVNRRAQQQQANARAQQQVRSLNDEPGGGMIFPN